MNRDRDSWKPLLRVIILIAAILFMIDKCNDLIRNNPVQHTETSTKIVHDTCWYPIAEKRKPKAADSVFIPVPAIVDTQVILQQYFAKYFYADTLADTNIVIAVKDTISQNRIVSRSYAYQIKRPTLIQQISNTTIEPKQRSTFYVGASAAVNRNLVVGLSPEIMLMGRNKVAYGVGYDILNKSVSGRIYWKLNLRYE